MHDDLKESEARGNQGQTRKGVVVRVRPASVPEELPIVRMLFQEYADGLGIDLCFQGFAEELAELPGRYARPAGGLWLAFADSHLAGCVALRPIDARVGEIKRLYVRSSFRGLGLGRTLAEQALEGAASAGYHRVCLDTLPSMGNAIALYRSLGFTEVEPYCHNPVPGVLFFEKELTH